MTRNHKFPAPPVDEIHSPLRAGEIVQIANSAINRYSGNSDELEKALGMLMLGDYVGWKVLIVLHNKRTIRKYEDILGINIREFFIEEGPIAGRSIGYELAIKLGSFWKVVSGDVSVANRRDFVNQDGKI